MYAPVVPSKTIPDSRPKWVKCFQTKKAQKPFPLGGTYLYGLYKGVPLTSPYFPVLVLYLVGILYSVRSP